ncbi:FixH family protein [Leadbetterella sp. DM7]|uniref:FixH family protein n=1 Tax=Leadbetterella sp. DM7 TaxID=3235085 RepID=UPI00349ED669
MNFGHKIAIVYTLFVVFIISLVTFCVKQKDIFLVSNDYYKKEMAYQEEIDKYANTGQLSQPVKIINAGEFLTIQFPEEMQGASGEIHFYRPSDANLDFRVPVRIDPSNSQKIAVSQLVKGKWVVKMEWSKEGKNYLKEEKIIL